jgi:hypothetical protein
MLCDGHLANDERAVRNLIVDLIEPFGALLLFATP